MANNLDIFFDPDDIKADNKIIRISVVIYVEGYKDILFWEEIFNKFASNLTVDIRLPSNYDNVTIGKARVLNLKQYAQYAFPDMILCVDSDYDYWLKKEPIYSHPYIFHTYSYSIENYSIHPSQLNIILRDCICSSFLDVIELMRDCGFCFEEFIKQYSVEISKIFKYIISLKKMENDDYFQDKSRIKSSLSRISNKKLEDIVGRKTI